MNKKGWFTEYPKSWELKNLWMVFLSLILVFPTPIPFYPIAFTYMGIKAKRSSFVFLGIISAIICFTIFGGLYYFNNLNFWIVLAIISPLAGNISLMLIVESFLKRLALGKTTPLTWRETKVSEKILTVDLNIQTFTSKLNYWGKEIENASIKTNLTRMVELLKNIDSNDIAFTNLLLTRHAQTINRTLEQYNNIEDSRLDNEIIEKSKAELTEVIHLSTRALENEITNHLKSSLLTISAETDAYLQTLRNRGVLNNE